MTNRRTSYAAGHALVSAARRTLWRAGLLGAAILASGCATAYQPHGLTGGFEEAQVNANSFRVSFRGNGYTSTNRAEELTLLRSAEICLEHGFPGFVLLRERTDIKNESLWMSNTTVRRGNVFSTGTNFNFEMPSTSNLVTCITEKPQNVFSYDALVLYESLSLKYQVPRSKSFSDWQDKLGQVRISAVQENPQPAPAARPAVAQEQAPRSKEWLASAAGYSRSIGCSAEPGLSSFTPEGAEQYEFSCLGRPALKLECWTVFGGCRRPPIKTK